MWIVRGVAGFICLFTPALAQAHAFGQQFTLALPISYYIFGGTAAFIVSACIILLFSKPLTDTGLPPPKKIPYRNPRLAVKTFRILGLVALLIELALCFFGSTSYFENPSIVLFWVIFLIGFTYLSALVGGIWEVLNPFRTLAGRLVSSPVWPYPRWLSYWPSVLLFLLLIIVELYVGSWASDPFTLGMLLLFYTSVMLLGSTVYGVQSWFTHADVFGVFFRMVSMCAPLTLTDSGVERTAPGVQLVRLKPEHMTLVVFILFMLSATAFDGLHETRPWWSLLRFVRAQGFSPSPEVFGTLGLLLSPFVFFSLYAIAIWLTHRLSGKKYGFRYLILRFGYSLIPIAVAYHFAHYFTLLMSEGQRLIYQLSDPFSRGWDLFDTSSYMPNFTPLGADTVWYIQLGTIVVGHVMAALIAHRIAVREFNSSREILLSQLPMLVLMVGYTAFGLWVLSRAFVT